MQVQYITVNILAIYVYVLCNGIGCYMYLKEDCKSFRKAVGTK